MHCRIMMTEAYTSMDMIMRFYESDDGVEQRAHFPFNFAMITELNAQSKARDFKYVIDRFLENMPRGKVTNWVVSISTREATPTSFNLLES